MAQTEVVSAAEGNQCVGCSFQGLWASGGGRGGGRGDHQRNHISARGQKRALLQRTKKRVKKNRVWRGGGGREEEEEEGGGGGMRRGGRETEKFTVERGMEDAVLE